MPQLSSLQSTLLPSLEGIDLAGRMLEWQLKNDNQFPSLSDQIKIGEGKVNFTALKRFPHLMSLSVLAHGVSGLCDVDYPMLEVGPNGLPLLRQMGLVNRIPLPPELVSILEVSCLQLYKCILLLIVLLLIMQTCRVIA